MAIPRRGGHQGRVRPSQLGGVGPVVAQMTQEAFGYKFHWAVADYLQRSARHIASKVDVEQAYAVGKAAVEFALAGQERGDADHRAQILDALSLEHRRGAARGNREPGKESAAQFHHGGWIRHHRRLPALPAAADRRRGLPALPRRPARPMSSSRAAACRSACADPLWYSFAAGNSNKLIFFNNISTRRLFPKARTAPLDDPETSRNDP